MSALKEENTTASNAQDKLVTKTISTVLGEAVWLLTQSTRHKKMELGDLEWLLMPAIMLRQFKIFYNGDQPVGLALWALVDSAVAERMDKGDNRLANGEWRCGEHARLVDVIAPFGQQEEMRRRLEETFAALSVPESKASH